MAENAPSPADVPPNLFTQDGMPMGFYVVRAKAGFSELNALIQAGGGFIHKSWNNDLITLAPITQAVPDGYATYLPDYIVDSIRAGALQDLVRYRRKPGDLARGPAAPALVRPPQSTAPGSPRAGTPKRGRARYTAVDDAALVNYVTEAREREPKLMLKGKLLWQQAEETKVTEHSWQSMRDHYLKHVLPVVERRNQLAVPAAPPSAAGHPTSEVPPSAPATARIASPARPAPPPAPAPHAPVPSSPPAAPRVTRQRSRAQAEVAGPASPRRPSKAAAGTQPSDQANPDQSSGRAKRKAHDDDQSTDTEARAPKRRRADDTVAATTGAAHGAAVASPKAARSKRGDPQVVTTAVRRCIALKTRLQVVAAVEPDLRQPRTARASAASDDGPAVSPIARNDAPPSPVRPRLVPRGWKGRGSAASVVTDGADVPLASSTPRPARWITVGRVKESGPEAEAAPKRATARANTQAAKHVDEGAAKSAKPFAPNQASHRERDQILAWVPKAAATFGVTEDHVRAVLRAHNVNFAAATQALRDEQSRTS